MKRTGMKRNVFAAALAAAVVSSVSIAVFLSYGATYNYDWDSGEDSDGYSVPFRLVRDEEDDEDEDEDGLEAEPGVVRESDSGLGTGPSVSQSAMSERYHEEYKVYEESIEGIFFFYSSVANGGITHEPVELDLPANLTWTAEKDGQQWIYQPGQPITERGTYVFRFCGIEDNSVPLSEQKEYRAVFRFRIQEKPPEESKAETEPGSEGTQLSGGAVDGYDSLILGGQTASGLNLGPDGQLTGAVAGIQGLESIAGSAGDGSTSGTEADLAAAESSSGADGSGEEITDGLGGESEDGLSEGAVDGSGEETAGGLEIEAGEGVTAEGTADGVFQGGTSESMGKAAFAQAYDASLAKYQVNFNNGTAITSNVPGGYMGAGPVEISLPEGSTEGLGIYRDDVALTELDSEDGALSFGEAGYYRLESGDASWSFAIVTATSQMDVYPAPVGMEFKEAALDGQALELSSRGYVLMEADGQYALTMEGKEGETLTVGILKDTEPPQIEVTTGKGSASIQYLSEDIDNILLEKDGEPVEGFKGYSITSPGSYRLTVKDAAGNTAGTSFTLKYRINTYGIAAVILVILVIVGIVVFVIHTKRTVKVR